MAARALLGENSLLRHAYKISPAPRLRLMISRLLAIIDAVLVVLTLIHLRALLPAFLADTPRQLLIGPGEQAFRAPLSQKRPLLPRPPSCAPELKFIS